MSAPDDFCHANTPDDLRRAVRDVALLQRWVKGRSEKELMEGFECIYPHHTVQRSIIREAIEHARHREAIEATKAGGSSKSSSKVVAFALTLLGGIIVGLVIAYLKGCLPEILR
jgi:hypothetical protein